MPTKKKLMKRLFEKPHVDDEDQSEPIIPTIIRHWLDVPTFREVAARVLWASPEPAVRRLTGMLAKERKRNKALRQKVADLDARLQWLDGELRMVIATRHHPAGCTCTTCGELLPF